MPKRFVLTFFAPYVMGGGDGRLFRAPFLGPSFYTEYVPYAGVITIVLALVGVVLSRDWRTRFWVVVVVAGLLLAFGRYAPFSLNELTYYVPLLNLFRVPARHLLEVHFAVAVLAAEEMGAGDLADLHRHLGRHRRLVGAAADAIGAEIFARHKASRMLLAQ